jgi:hypothetical protein
MTHLTDDDLVLHFYGEDDGARPGRAHLDECQDCRRRFDLLSAALRAMSADDVPERGERYGAEVWARIEARLEGPDSRSWFGWIPSLATWPRLAMGGAVAALLVAAFVAGRSTLPPSSAPAPAVAPRPSEAPSDAARERALLAAVGSHLDRSRVVLTEIAHRNGGGPADISPEQETAADLVAASRLYRQAAVRNGDAAVASVLEDLERVLVEIANCPSPASHDDLARWREQIDTKGLLFKVTVLGSRVRQRQQEGAAAAGPGTKTST